MKVLNGFYQASDLGRIKSIARKGTKGGILKQRTKNGYCIIDLTKNMKKTTHLVHRIIAKTFIPNPQNKTEINHKNGIKTDNNINNLEWCTPSENKKHAWDNGLRSREKISKLYMGCGNPFYGKHHTTETKNKIKNKKLKDTI